MDDLVASVAVFAKEQEHIQADVKEIKADGTLNGLPSGLQAVDLLVTIGV